MGTCGKTVSPAALVPRIVGEVDRGHPALPDLSLERVAVGEGATKGVEDVHDSTANVKPRSRRRGGRGTCPSQRLGGGSGCVMAW